MLRWWTIKKGVADLAYDTIRVGSDICVAAVGVE
jgi:hypothetical protein